MTAIEERRLLRELATILQAGSDGIPLELRLEHLDLLRRRVPAATTIIDRFMIEQHDRYARGFTELKSSFEDLKQLNEQLTATPWIPAVFIRHLETSIGQRALVGTGAGQRVVGLTDGIDQDTLRGGDEVYLGHELNVIVARSPQGVPRYGETAVFERRTDDGRLVLKIHEEEVVVDAAGALRAGDLKTGDRLLFDRTFSMAYERLDRASANSLFIEETPDESFAAIGGLDHQIQELENIVDLHLNHADAARQYRINREKSVLLVGPPGTGKTMMARALANRLGSLSTSGRSRFINVKPGSMSSMWYGQSEANIRELFRVAREAGQADPAVPVVLFFDEFDSLAPARGHSMMHVDSRIVTAFSAELQGLEDMGNLLVVGATNRVEDIDPALRRAGRMGDRIIVVPRPSVEGARDIFSKHLPADVPYAVDGYVNQGDDARDELIAIAVSAIYAPNGDGELATIRFRDGQTRAVRRRDLVSGAAIAKIAMDARRRACFRHIEGGPAGVRGNDLLDAIEEEFTAMAQTLTPGNCRQFLSGLPQDIDIVAVEPLVRRITKPHHYLTLFAA